MTRRLALSVLLLFSAVVTRAETPGEVPVGGTLREAQLRGLNGPPRALSGFRGRPLIINVWASWCGPCRSEMASLERLAWPEQATRFAIIGISSDDYIEQARGWLNDSNATIYQFIDTNLQMENMLGATKLPLTVFVDARGRVLRKVYGARQWDSAESLRLVGDTFALGASAPARR